MNTQNPDFALYEFAKKVIKKPFHAVGWDLKLSLYPMTTLQPPPLYDNPLEALCMHQGGKRVAFECPFNQSVTLSGFRYDPDGWHPFVETVQQYAAGHCTTYEDSILQRYYDVFQPCNAAEAIPGFKHAPSSFSEFPPHLHRLSPWSSYSLEEVDKSVRGAARKDNAEHGGPSLSFELDGYHSHGPVSLRKGRLEFERLRNLSRRLEANGFDRSYGDTHFQLLRRGDEYRFLRVGTGTHRTAVTAGLGYDVVPAQFRHLHVIDISMVDYWPQVRRGIWDRESAEAYFHHLMDFDSRAWANDLGLLHEAY